MLNKYIELKEKGVIKSITLRTEENGTKTIVATANLYDKYTGEQLEDVLIETSLDSLKIRKAGLKKELDEINQILTDLKENK